MRNKEKLPNFYCRVNIFRWYDPEKVLLSSWYSVVAIGMVKVKRIVNVWCSCGSVANVYAIFNLHDKPTFKPT